MTDGHTWCQPKVTSPQGPKLRFISSHSYLLPQESSLSVAFIFNTSKAAILHPWLPEAIRESGWGSSAEPRYGKRPTLPYRVLRPCICICRNACDVVSSREQSWRCHAIDGLAAFPRQLLRAPSPSGRPTTCVVVVDTTHLPLPATPPGSGLGHEGRGPKL